MITSVSLADHNKVVVGLQTIIALLRAQAQQAIEETQQCHRTIESQHDHMQVLRLELDACEAIANGLRSDDSIAGPAANAVRKLVAKTSKRKPKRK